MFPPLILFTRKVQQDVELKGKRPFPKSRHAQGCRWFGLGGGSHICLRQQFTGVQMKTTWAYLLRNYDMKLAGKLPEPDRTAMGVGWHRPRKSYITLAQLIVCVCACVCVHARAHMRGCSVGG